MADSPRPRTIAIRVSRYSQRDEGVADVAGIYPGMVLEKTGDAKLKKHATAGGSGERLVALEDRLAGKTVDDVYADENIVFYQMCQDGDEVMVLLLDGETIVENDALKSDGAGRVRKAATSGNQVMFRAMESLDLSGGASADMLIKARVVHEVIP